MQKLSSTCQAVTVALESTTRCCVRQLYTVQVLWNAEGAGGAHCQAQRDSRTLCDLQVMHLRSHASQMNEGNNHWEE